MKRTQRILSSSLSVNHHEHSQPGRGKKEMTLHRCDKLELELGSTIHRLLLTWVYSSYANLRVIRAKRLYRRRCLQISMLHLHLPLYPCIQTKCCSLARQRHRSISYHSWST